MDESRNDLATEADEDIWRAMGFSKNPYNFRPLRVSAEDRELFVGRPREKEQFRIQVAGTDGGIVLVQGQLGVGKTSFVNAMQYAKWNPTRRTEETGKNSVSSSTSSYLPSFETVELKENVDLTDFMLSVLSNCVYSLEKVHPSADDPDLREGKELVANTVKRGLGGFSISILGSGGGIEKSETVTQPPARIPLQTVMHIMDKWLDRVVSKFHYKAILVPINNLDIVSENWIVEFLNSARDTLLSRHHVWWILIGGTDLASTLDAKARRVSEMITGQPINLEPISLSELYSAIGVRIEKYKIDKKAKPPVPQPVVDLLYKVSGGEIRYIFRKLTNIVYDFKLTFPSENEIPLDVATKSVKILAQNELSRLNLTTRDETVLKKAAIRKNFRIRDYGDFGYSSPQAFQQVVSRLSHLNLLSKVQKNPKEVLYSATGDVKLVYSPLNM